MQTKTENIDINIPELIREYLGVFDLSEKLKDDIVKNISNLDEKEQEGALALIISNMQALFQVKKDFLDKLKKIRTRKLKDLNAKQISDDDAEAEKILDSIN